MKSLLAIAALIVLQLGLEGCGQDIGKTSTNVSSERTGTTASGFADATAKQPAAATPADKPQTEEMCLGVALHGDHQQCDAGDDQVGDRVAAGDEPNAVVPAPAASTPAPADPAPAAQPAEPTVKPDPVADKPAPAPTPLPAPAPVPAPAPKDPNIVEFHIKAGTGNKPWNTAAELVTVKVGQTLRLINDDTVTHRLHTGGAPCPHGENFAAGKTFDCKVTKTLDPAKQPGATYDHIAGDTALFFLKAVP